MPHPNNYNEEIIYGEFISEDTPSISRTLLREQCIIDTYGKDKIKLESIEYFDDNSFTVKIST